MLTLTKRNTKGILLVAVTKVEEATSRNGHPELVFTFRVVDSPQPEDINAQIGFQHFYVNNQTGINRLMDFIGAVMGQEIAEGDSIDVNEETLNGLLQQTVTIELVEEKYSRSDGTQGTSFKIKDSWPADDYARQVQEKSTRPF